MKEKYHIYGLASGVYAVFLTFCLYHNAQGITYPFFVAGTLFYFCYTMKKSGITCKKDNWFYAVSLMLLGCSVFLTMDERILLISKTGIFLLFTGFLLHNFYQDEKWNFTKYLQSILEAVLNTIGSLFTPLTDFLYFLQNGKQTEVDENGAALPRKENKVKYLLFGLIIAVPLVVVIIFALSSADLVFRDMCSRFFRFIGLETIIGIIVMTIAAYFISYATVRSLLKREIREECKECRNKEPLLAITFTSIITIIYLLFCGIQIVYLFAGKGALPQDYSYAQYAKQGFYELLFVCLMNLVILLVCLSFFRESSLLKAILSVITLCTYVMVTSSAYRMYLYVDAYYFTFLRLMVFFFLLLISILMLGIFITIYKKEFPLFRYSMIIVTIFTIILAYSHPDYLIARYNVSNLENLASTSSEGNSYYEYGNSAYQDIYYLTRLCEDSAPVLTDPVIYEKLYAISPEDMEEYKRICYDKKDENNTFRHYNVSRAIFQKKVAE